MTEPTQVRMAADVLAVPLADKTGLMISLGVGPLGQHITGTPSEVIGLLHYLLGKAEALGADVERANIGLVVANTIPSDLPNNVTPLNGRPNIKPHVPGAMPWQQ